MTSIDIDPTVVSEHAEARAYQGDSVLQSLVEIVRNSSTEIGITLNVGGTIVTGTLVCGTRYFEGMAAISREKLPGGMGDTFGSFFDQFATSLKSEIAENVMPPAYIHLKNVRFVYPGSTIPTVSDNSTWWRGKLASVDGFVLGSIDQTASK